MSRMVQRGLRAPDLWSIRLALFALIVAHAHAHDQGVLRCSFLLITRIDYGARVNLRLCSCQLAPLTPSPSHTARQVSPRAGISIHKTRFDSSCGLPVLPRPREASRNRSHLQEGPPGMLICRAMTTIHTHMSTHTTSVFTTSS